MGFLFNLLNGFVTRKQFCDHDIWADAQKGARCRICGSLIHWDNSRDDGRCAAHGHQRTGEESWLAGETEQIQDNLLSQLRLQQNNMSQLDELEGRGGANVRMRRSLLVTRRCCWSVSRLADQVHRRFLEDENSPVKEVKEVDIRTNLWYNYQHSLFLVVTGQTTYAFDPTGIQFGLDWPLLQDWTQYREQRAMFVDSINPLGTAAGKKYE